ncbi:Uncharacterised protein [Mycobacteroides abscessus subsp. abscessus]|nr:Uncharacterised protein [Mycobacteroides abscessus subsp. abscessus]
MGGRKAMSEQILALALLGNHLFNRSGQFWLHHQFTQLHMRI